MIYKKSIIDIIEDFKTKIIPVCEIISYNFIGTNTHKITVKNLFYLQKGFTLKIQNRDYLIESIGIVENNMVLTGLTEITVKSFPIYLSKFFHGTIRQTNNELQDYVSAKDKTPMLYLYENFTERFFEDNDNILERESDLRLYFLSQADFQAWQTNDFYYNCIIPMRRLMEMFIDKLKSSNILNPITSYDTTSHTHFGVYINEKGYEKSFWADNLSGVELRITLPLIKQEQCGAEC